jgi:hypothetical protein
MVKDTLKNSRVMVHVYLTSEEKKRIEEEAGKLGISVSSYINLTSPV